MTRAFVSPRFRSASCIVFLWCFAVVVTSAIALRVEAAIYASRIVSVVTALSTLRLGETSKAEILRRIPTLQPSNARPYGALRCDADECFSGLVGNGLPARILLRTRNSTLASLLRWWGFRFEGLDVGVKFTSGKVSYFAYRLMVSAPGVIQGVPPPPRDGEAGAVVIGLSSLRIIDSGEPNSTEKRHLPYRVLPARSAPSQGVSIALTPDAPEEVVHRAFDLRLHCIWSFGGCRRWNQLLPAVQPLLRR